jgi:hypothetical protein
LSNPFASFSSGTCPAGNDYKNVTNKYQEPKPLQLGYILIRAGILRESNSATMSTFTVQNEAIFEQTNLKFWITLCPPKLFP